MTHHENSHRGIPDLVQFMTIVVDLVIVNVAIAATQQQPGFAASVLPWSLITYGLLFGSFVLLGGWLGPGRPVPPTSSAAGRARNITFRMFGATAAASGAIRVLAQRLLPEAPGWYGTVFVHLPAAVLLVGLALRLLPRAVVRRAELELEANSAMVVTGAIMLVVYGLHSGAELGWSSPFTLALLASGAILLTAFGWVESRTRPAGGLAGDLAEDRIDDSQQRAMVTPDVTMCFTLGVSGAQTWPPASGCPDPAAAGCGPMDDSTRRSGTVGQR